MRRLLRRLLTGSTMSIAVATVLVALTLSACSRGGDDKPSSTTVPESSSSPTSAQPTAKPTEIDGTAKPSALTDANSQSITDGVCVALIPDGWVDDGTGRGTTTSGARFVLFGGRVSSDADWTAAIDIVATPTAGEPVSSVDRDDDSIHVVYADDLGFEYRKRFDTVYCDFTVTSSSKAIAEDERAFWPAIIDSLGPANRESSPGTD